VKVNLNNNLANYRI